MEPEVLLDSEIQGTLLYGRNLRVKSLIKRASSSATAATITNKTVGKVLTSGAFHEIKTEWKKRKIHHFFLCKVGTVSFFMAYYI